MNFDLDFYKGKKVFVTGHTGFKGSWLCKMLANAGAIVTGYSLNPPTSPSLFEIAGIEQDVHSVIGDIRDFKTLKAAFDEAQPEMVLHLAAQPRGAVCVVFSNISYFAIWKNNEDFKDAIKLLNSIFKGKR